MLHPVAAITVLTAYFALWWFAVHILVGWRHPVLHLLVMLLGISMPMIIVDALAATSYRG